jgi:hypothetical protein
MLPDLFDHPAILVGLVILLGVFLAIQRKKQLPYPLPPGPPAEPLIGHYRSIPALNPEHKYIEWGKQYSKTLIPKMLLIIKPNNLVDSDILYLNVLGRPIIVINSTKVAHELLDKRGANYADRPRFVLFEV